MKREMRRKLMAVGGVMICGAYGKGNAGDEAILKAILTALPMGHPTAVIRTNSQIL